MSASIVLIILYLTNLLGSFSCDNQYKTTISEKQCVGQSITIAVGAKDFKDLVANSDIFVDKTLLIKELLENHANRSIITYPRRTGKTINLQMIKNFLEIEVDENGTKISPLESTTNYKLFKYGEIIFNNITSKLKHPLLIAKEDQLFDKYHGKYPVIYLDFGNIDGVMVKGNFWKNINNTIINAFRQHTYMINILEQKILSTTMEEQMKKKIVKQIKLFRQIAYGQITNNNHFCLQILSEILFEYFNKKVFVLVDGYDIPAYRKVHFDYYMSEEEKNMTTFIIALVNQTVERNPYMEKAILTGTFQLRDVVWRLWFDKPQKYNIYNHRLFPYYAYTKNETDALFDYAQISKTQREKAHLWYNGYQTEIQPDKCFYNPWSVASFINTRKLLRYWSEDPGTDIAFYLFESCIPQVRFRHFMLPLVLGKCLSIDDDKVKFSYEELETMTLHAHIAVPDPRRCNVIMSHFFAYGYLTLCNGTYFTDGSIELRIPNREVMEKFISGISRFYYRRKYNITSGDFNIVTKQLLKFFENNETHSEPLIDSLKTIFRPLPFLDLTPGRTAYLVQDAFRYIVARIKFYHNYMSDIPPENNSSDLIIYKNNRGIVLQATTNYTTPLTALVMAKCYKNVFKGIDSVKTIKYIAFNIPMPDETNLIAECEDIATGNLIKPSHLQFTQNPNNNITTKKFYVHYSLPPFN